MLQIFEKRASHIPVLQRIFLESRQKTFYWLDTSDYNLNDFNAILKDRNFKKCFGELSDCKLKTVPKGYDRANPAIDHLRQTSFIIERSFDDKDVIAANFKKECTANYKAMLPFLAFMNVAMEG